MSNRKYHPRVSGKLDDWQKLHYSEYFYWLDEGNEPTDDKGVLRFLLTKVYDDAEKERDMWTKERYLKWRTEVMRKVFPTVYYPELIDRLAAMNLKFGVK